MPFSTRLRGTHDGDLMGIPSSGQQVSSDGMVFARFGDGNVVERWSVQGMLTLLQQIGAFAAADATG
ncbi:MAG TPA: ester cyclase [Solirubrobacteraceae bacterium]|nr:ester cyclase [Solirubrobacteraceae bacterium]